VRERKRERRNDLTGIRMERKINKKTIFPRYPYFPTFLETTTPTATTAQEIEIPNLKEENKVLFNTLCCVCVCE